MLSLRTRGPRAIRSARPQRAKLTPASVTPANASDFAIDAAWTGPARMWLGRARARHSRLPPTRRSRPKSSRFRFRAAPPLDSTARVCRVVPLAERVAVPRAPTLAAKSPSALFARCRLRGSRTTRSKRREQRATTAAFCSVSRQISHVFHGSLTPETPRVFVTRSHKYRGSRRSPKQLLRRDCLAKTYARAVGRNGVERVRFSLHVERSVQHAGRSRRARAPSAPRALPRCPPPRARPARS